MPLLDSTVHILLVEDDEVDIQNVERAFVKHNVSNPLHIARNGAEAMDKIYGLNGETMLDPSPKIILLDINMPKVNGIEFLTKLRTDPDFNSVLVFILTTSNEERDKVAAYNLNVAGYILKPVQFNDFLETIAVLNLYWALLEFPK
jgi:CheY-like chemotaxis protein